MKPDFFAELAAYVPADAREAEEKAVILDYALRFPDTVLTRENRVAHITSSAFVVNTAGNKTLMAHHIQRGVWAWRAAMRMGMQTSSPLPCARRRRKPALRACARFLRTLHRLMYCMCTRM